MVASRLLIITRGSSRFAVRGFKASSRASTRRLKPMAALRAAIMATMIQPRLAIVIGTRPRRQKDTRESERKRKYRVTGSARTTGRRACDSCSSLNPSHLLGMDSRHEVFFHIVNPRRNVDCEQPGAFAGFDSPVVGVESERTAPPASSRCRAVLRPAPTGRVHASPQSPRTC